MTHLEDVLRWKAKKRAEGKCVLCGKKLQTKNHCHKHAAKQSEYARNYYNKHKAKK